MLRKHRFSLVKFYDVIFIYMYMYTFNMMPQVEEFKHVGILFMSNGRIDQEMDQRIGDLTRPWS